MYFFKYENPMIVGYAENVILNDDFIEFNCSFGFKRIIKTNVNFIHDFTLGEFHTDSHLDNLSPDLVTEKEIIELTTTLSTNELVLKDKLTNKIAKYQSLAEKHNKELKVIVVSLQKIISNVELNTKICDDMIERFQIALSVRQYCYDVYNLELWKSENETKFERILAVVLDTTPIVQAKNDFESSLDSEFEDMTIDDFKYFNDKCFEKIQNFQVDMYDFTNDFKIDGERCDFKRVIPVSLIIPEAYDSRVSFRNSLLADFLNSEDKTNVNLKIMMEAISKVKISYDTMREEQIAFEEAEIPKTRSKSMYRFKCNLDSIEGIELALSGVQAKKFKDDPIIKDKRSFSKKSFSLNCPINDIDNFINTNYLMNYDYSKIKDFCLTVYDDWSNDLKSFPFSARTNSNVNENLIKETFKKYSSSVLLQYCRFLQALFTEINLSVRDNSDTNFFIAKPIPSFNCDVYIKNVGSSKPIFFFIVAKPNYKFNDVTVGVKYVETPGGLCVSDWSSVKLRDIENYLSIFSRTLSTLAYLNQIHDNEEIISQHINFILLIQLSNKDRDEELITLLRYVYMRSLSLSDNVTTLVNKLPNCLRSRLNVYQVVKTLNLIKRLHKNKPKVKMIHNDRDIENLFDIFGNNLNFKQILNFCYYGYCVNKTKQSEINQSSKLIDKILEYDLKLNDGSLLSGVNENQLDDHLHDKRFLKVICHLAETRIKQSFGENYKKHFEQDLINHMRKQNFMSLATIKASAKTDLPVNTNKDSIEMLKRRRPKVIESLKKLIDECGAIEHPIELVNFCIRKLDNDDSFNVELFSKDQHAGIREIYVVDIKVRVIQWFLETISRCLCRLFSSETMVNPDMKDFLYQKMTRDSILKLEDPIVLCRSGDASKWSQTQNVTKFYQVLSKFLPTRYHKIIKSILILWYRKKIYLPASLIEVCQSFKGKIDNTTINYIRDVYGNNLDDGRLKNHQPFLRVKTGFMQGILHFTSSFFHTIVQEAFVVYKSLIIHKLFPESRNKNLFYNLIMQGSDDNSESLIVSRKLYKKSPRLFIILTQLKDIMSKFVGIKVSAEKTASCVPFLMEYNSTWELAGKFVMPTIKFVFVACDIPQKQTLVGRQEFYYSLLSNCLEKGASLITCSLIRLAQCEQHFLQLGYLHNQLFQTFYNLIRINKSPALGFFMFEPVVVTGLLGFDFMLFFHSIETSFRYYIDIEEKEIPSQILSNLGYKAIADYTISKFHYKRYDEIIKTLNLGNIEESRKKINERPEILYKVVNDKTLEFDMLNLKMHDFSVKESLTSRFSKSEMFSSLIYVLSRPVCYYKGEKKSLLILARDLSSKNLNETLTRSIIIKNFCRSEQYLKLIEEIKPMINNNVLIRKSFVQRGSSKIKLLEGLNDESYKLLELCKAKWFNIKNIPISDRILDKYFDAAKCNIPWLRDTEFETRDNLKIDSFQLYYYLMNSFKDNKTIKLLDTPGKKGNLKYLISRITEENHKLEYIPTKFEETKDFQKQLQANIKFTCDFPFEFHYKIEILKSLISDYLSTNLKNNDKQILNLILNLLNNDKMSFENNLFKYQHDLNLAIFTKPQKFNNLTGEWQGTGVLLCKYGSLIYELLLKDNRVEKIAVNDLVLARDKFHAILKTVKDLNLTLKATKSEPNLKLNVSGISIDSFGSELHEEPELSFNLENLKNVSIVIEHERIKIVTKSKVKDINSKSFLDSTPLSEMYLYEDRELGPIWVDKEKVPKGKTIISKQYMCQSEAIQVITLCSFKTRFLNFDNKYKPLFEINSFAKLFWKQIQDPNKLLLKVNSIIKKHSISNLSDFLIKMKLEDKSIYLFRDLLLGKFRSRDEIKLELDVNDISEDYTEIKDFFSDFFMNDSLSNLEDIIDLPKEFDDNIETSKNDIFQMNFFLDDYDLEILAEKICKSTRGFYIHYTTNDVVETKLFETIGIMIKNKGVDLNKLIKKGDGLDKLNDSYKNLVICLFGVPGSLIVEEKHETKDSHVSALDIITEPLKLREAIIQNIYQNWNFDNDFIDSLKDLISQTEVDINNLTEVYKKQRSPAIKMRTQQRIDTMKSYLENLLFIDNYILENVNNDLNDSEDFEIDMSDDENDLKYFGEIKIKDLTTINGEENVLISHAIINIIKFIKYEVKGDGSCLFRSLLFSILPLDRYLYNCNFYNFRDIIASTIERFNLNDLNMIRNSFGSDYPDKLRNPNEWGDIYCIYAFGVITNSLIHIKNENNWLFTVGCKSTIKEYDIYLEWINGNHYNPLFPEIIYNKFLLDLDEIKNQDVLPNL